MSLKSDLRQLLRPYYLINILLSLSYIVLKRIPGVCNYVFRVEDCEFDGRETEILFFLMIVIMIRTRKAGTVSMVNYLSSSFVYTKLANVILWFHADVLMGLIYSVIFILVSLLVPQPTYTGPTNVIYFRGKQCLLDELHVKTLTAHSDTSHTYWLIAFYTVWSPACVNLAPIFAELSCRYALPKLRWGKLDVGRYPDVARMYRISDSSLSKQLPTIILFRNGEEIVRRPHFVDDKSNVARFSFTTDAIKAAFDLNNLYEQCKQPTRDNTDSAAIKKRN